MFLFLAVDIRQRVLNLVTANTTQTQFTFNFLMNQILICYCHFQLT
jgi:hypothetical protein